MSEQRIYRGKGRHTERDKGAVESDRRTDRKTYRQTDRIDKNVLENDADRREEKKQTMNKMTLSYI